MHKSTASDTSKTAKITKRWYYSAAHWHLGDVLVYITFFVIFAVLDVSLAVNLCITINCSFFYILFIRQLKDVILVVSPCKAFWWLDAIIACCSMPWQAFSNHYRRISQWCQCSSERITKNFGWFRGAAVSFVFDRRAFAVLRSIRQVTTYLGKPSTIGQPTKPTQPFIFSGSVNE